MDARSPLRVGSAAGTAAGTKAVRSLDNVVVLENVSKRYRIYSSPRDHLRELIGIGVSPERVREVAALSRVSLSIKRGEFCGVIGRNGAGKSTFLKVIAGQIAPTEGSVRVTGRRSLLQLGVGFDNELTGRENVYNSLRYTQLGASVSEDVVEEIVKFAEIGDFINFPIKTYSSGMHSRLAFATAVAVDPDILIADEVLAVGDINFIQKCLAKMSSFKDRGKTVILVTHDIGTVRVFCDRAVLFESGEVLRDGDPVEVCEAYRNMMLYGVSAATPSDAAEDAVQVGERSGAVSPDAATGEDHAGSSDAGADPPRPTGEGQPGSWLPPRRESLVAMLDVGKTLATRMRYPRERHNRTDFEGGRRVCFDYVFRLREGVEFHSVGVTMHNSLGQIVLHLNSTLGDLLLRRDSGQDVRGVTLEFDLPLFAPGQYSISHGINVIQSEEALLAFKHDFDFSLEIGYPRAKRFEQQGGLVLVDGLSSSEMEVDLSEFPRMERA